MYNKKIKYYHISNISSYHKIFPIIQNHNLSQNISISTAFYDYVYYKLDIPAYKQISELFLTITSSSDSDNILYYIIQKNYDDLELHNYKASTVKERNFI